MSIRFDQPVWLLLTIMAIPMVIVGWRWFAAMSPVRRFTAMILRVALIALIAGALAGASAVSRSDRLAVLAVIDLSGSVQQFYNAGTDATGRRTAVEDAVRRFLKDAASQQRPDDLLGIVAFDGRAIAIASPTSGDPLVRTLTPSGTDGSDLAGALELAGALVPADAAGRIILFSDGNETTGDVLASAQRLAQTGPNSALRRIRVDVVPLEYQVDAEVIVESVDSPPLAPEDAFVTVRVVLQATMPTTGTLQLLREDRPVDLNGDADGFGKRIALRSGRNIELVQVRLDSGRIHRFRAVFEPDRDPVAPEVMLNDVITANNSAESFTVSSGPGEVLLVDGVSQGNPDGPGATLARALERSGIKTVLRNAESFPTDMLALQAYDLIVLQNIAADDLSTGQHELIARCVEDLGGGLIMIGGPRAFGAGSWKGTAIEPILPVGLERPEKLVVPGAAVVFVLDNSGSMHRTVLGSDTQQQIANEGAALAIESLLEDDLVGVVLFNSSEYVLAPIAPNTNAKKTADRVRSIYSGGGTNLPPAMNEAYRMLRDVRAEVKHVIVLSDGGSENKSLLPELAQQMHADGISISTIAVGDQADLGTMRTIADVGGGTFYNVSDPTVLPRVFIRAVRVVRSPMIRLTPFAPMLTGQRSPATDGLGDMPMLRGLVLTQPRPEPSIINTLLAPTAEGEAVPLLAHWRVGLGAVGAFTSDASDWASMWLDWPGYAQMWTQFARLIARPSVDRAQELTLDLVDDELLIRMEATDESGAPLDLLSVPVAVYDPKGKRVQTRLVQTGAGVYETRVDARDPGSYVVTVMPRRGNAALPPIVAGVSRAGGIEFRRLASDLGLLEQIAELTGGQVRSMADGAQLNLFDRTDVRPFEARIPLWRSLMFWAIGVMLLDVATRRIAWDRLLSKQVRAEIRAAARDLPASDTAARVLSRLRTERENDQQRPQQLSTQDAAQIVREQATRRKQTRELQRAQERQARAQQKSSSQQSGSEQRPKQSDSNESDSAEEPTSGLMAAKRRAQQRFDHDQSED